MAYIKHTYSSGDILTAENMNHIEAGLELAAGVADAALTRSVGVVVDNNQSFSAAQKQQARTNIDAANVVVDGTTLIIS